MVLRALIILCLASQLHGGAALLPAPTSLGQLQKIKYHPQNSPNILLLWEVCFKEVLPTSPFLLFHAPPAVKNLANGLTNFGKLVGVRQLHNCEVSLLLQQVNSSSCVNLCVCFTLVSTKVEQNPFVKIQRSRKCSGKTERRTFHCTFLLKCITDMQQRAEGVNLINNGLFSPFSFQKRMYLPFCRVLFYQPHKEK